MKSLPLVICLIFLSGCTRHSSIVTVGQDRVREPGVIKDYAFYSGDMVSYFETLKEDQKKGILSVTQISDNQLKFVFSAKDRASSDSAVAALFDGFGYYRYEKQIAEWREKTDEYLRPFAALADRDPEAFRARALAAIGDSQRPQIEVFTLRIK